MVLKQLFLLSITFNVVFASISDLQVTIDSTRAVAIAYPGFVFPTLSSWTAACKILLQNRKGADFKIDSGFVLAGDIVKQRQEFSKVLSAWFKMMSSGPLCQESAWQLSNIGRQKPEDEFFDYKKAISFIPYAQKLILQPFDECYIRGDLHGDIHSLIIQLEEMKKNNVIDDNFRFIKDNVWMLFLGDYVDRGQYGCEVIYTLMRLALANPDRVVLVRGNHEDYALNDSFGENGFKDEVLFKFQDDPMGKIFDMISRLYDFLPVVLYLGCLDVMTGETNYLQCCHGGLEIGYDPKLFLDNDKTLYQLLGVLNRKTFLDTFKKSCDHRGGWTGWGLGFLKKQPYEYMKDWWRYVEGMLHDQVLIKSPMDAMGLGFMWYDFDVRNLLQVYYEKGRGIYYGHQITKEILKLQSSATSKICGVFRAHQHGDPHMMEALKRSLGVYKMWQPIETKLYPLYRSCQDGIVWTFNVGPDSMFGQDFKFDFDAYVRLILHSKFEWWKMQVFNTLVVQ